MARDPFIQDRIASLRALTAQRQSQAGVLTERPVDPALAPPKVTTVQAESLRRGECPTGLDVATESTVNAMWAKITAERTHAAARAIQCMKGNGKNRAAEIRSIEEHVAYIEDSAMAAISMVIKAAGYDIECGS